MASTQANWLLDRLENNKGTKIIARGKAYNIKPMCNAVAERMDRYTTKVSMGQEISITLSDSRSVVPKCLSLMLLHGWIKVTFFHWIYWRYIHRTYSQQEMTELLAKCFEVNSLAFFLTNMAYLQANSQMIEKITKVNSSTIIQELKLEEETTQ